MNITHMVREATRSPLGILARIGCILTLVGCNEPIQETPFYGYRVAGDDRMYEDECISVPDQGLDHGLRVTDTLNSEFAARAIEGLDTADALAIRGPATAAPCNVVEGSWRLIVWVGASSQLRADLVEQVLKLPRQAPAILLRAGPFDPGGLVYGEYVDTCSEVKQAAILGVLDNSVGGANEWFVEARRLEGVEAAANGDEAIAASYSIGICPEGSRTPWILFIRRDLAGTQRQGEIEGLVGGKS